MQNCRPLNMVRLTKSVLLSGDAAPVSIGSNSNLQDGVVISSGPTDPSSFSAGTSIGNNVTVGHAATLAGVTLEDECLIGMGATLHQGVKVVPALPCCLAGMVPSEAAGCKMTLPALSLPFSLHQDNAICPPCQHQQNPQAAFWVRPQGHPFS